jgi:DNA-binding transcriptional ArsR family regulator
MSGDRLEAVFAALSDPTRRDVVRCLAAGPASATQLATRLPVSRQAVSKHLGLLGEAGLVISRREGREIRYELTPAPMTEAMSWMAAVGARWDDRLGALQRHLAHGRAAGRS